jgi:site-specific recombinase XerD
MDLQNLREHHEELLSFMENNGYSSTYIQRFRDEINRILADADSSRWQSYRDVYLEYLKVPYSKDYLRNKRTIIGALEQFDLFGRLPDGRHRHTLFERGSYHLLEPEFQELIDFYRMYEKQRGKKESTIRGESLNTASFLYQMQGQGAQCLDEVTEDAVLSFFVSEDGSPRKGCSYKKNISAVFKAGLNWKEPQCQRILSFLPLLRETRKNIQCLTQDEIRLLRAAVESSGFSARNKAVILLLLFTGLRGCDIAGLTFSSIDWEKERILVEQQKTSMPVEIPLSAVVGNAIYDYLEQERPDTGALSLFLTETHPFSPISAQGIANIVSKACRLAGIRQCPGDRKGTHIFRHNLASSMLENGVPQPVITQTLGHTAPDSLEPYLRADFVHLKECALSIEDFPLAEEVFSL